MKKLLIFSIISICIISCDYDTRLFVFNHSKRKLWYFFERMDVRDTIPKIRNCESWTLYELFPMEDNCIITQDRWEIGLEGKPNKILRIYIYDEDTLSKYGNCGILKKPVYSKRFDLTYDDLIKLNWKIDYYDK